MTTVTSKLAVALVMGSASVYALDLHVGYSRSGWSGAHHQRLEYASPISPRNGLHLGLSHALHTPWGNLRLGLSHMARGNRATPYRAAGTLYASKEPPHDGPYWMENLGHDMDVIEVAALAEPGSGAVYALAGPYLGFQYRCREKIPSGSRNDCEGYFAAVDYGAAAGAGVRRRIFGLDIRADLLFSQGMRSLVDEDTVSIYNRGIVLQVGAGPLSIRSTSTGS